MKKRTLSSIGLATAVVASLIGAGAPVYASTTDVEAAPESTCSINYETQKTFCVEGDIEDLTAQLLEQQDVALVEADAQGRADLASARADASRDGDVQPLANYVLGVAYDDASYGGRTIVFNTSVSTTCSTHSFSWDELSFAYWQGFGWANVDDQISSVAPGPGCKMWLYVDSNRSGSVYKATGNAASLGWMNNQASSIWFTG
ncbi:hypothetical protein [Microbacterium sp. W4I20]|uniref:hypothetical protein n=1 Tax=Microbacterium sp. W4I20 TaxID=3042262 RepID=UPI00278A3591|nr:hypothetical protein [Microbacterium sp. W4I20]MDQ0727128.1 hypothetical protein [Microbacterium sp. W4I20]